jgi:hypothetical protein
VQYGNIAESNQPFGRFQERREVNSFDNANCSVAAPGANNGLGFGVVYSFLKVGSPLRIRSGVLKVVGKNMIAQHDFVTVVAQ